LEGDEAADLLNETLEEEKTADETLTKIAQNLNVEALNESEDDEEKVSKTKSTKKK
jgi:ferritin-like metal-binding protein YciE